jgi:hypothetical protein
VTGGPPDTSTFFILVPAMNPMYRLSGDQKGRPASSVPGTGWAKSEFMGRSQIRVTPVESVTLKAR